MVNDPILDDLRIKGVIFQAMKITVWQNVKNVGWHPGYNLDTHPKNLGKASISWPNIRCEPWNLPKGKSIRSADWGCPTYDPARVMAPNQILLVPPKNNGLSLLLNCLGWCVQPGLGLVQGNIPLFLNIDGMECYFPKHEAVPPEGSPYSTPPFLRFSHLELRKPTGIHPVTSQQMPI